MLDGSSAGRGYPSEAHLNVAVVGHVEWIEFAKVERLPRQGEIVEALDSWEEVGGGGAVAAVQLARLAGHCSFFTALGDDDRGHRAKDRLEELGLNVEVVWRPEPQRRAFVHTDVDAERTITVIGQRVAPHGEDTIPWGALSDADAVYLTASDAAGLRAARAARSLVATVRAREGLTAASVPIDMLVFSGNDPGETYTPGDLVPEPSDVACSEGEAGGVLTGSDGTIRRWDAAPLPGPRVDSYGAGDSFAGGVTFALASGADPLAAVELGARCGAACMTGSGPFAGQLGAEDLESAARR